MKAIVFDRIGPPLEVLQLRDVPVPEIRDNEVLVKMTAVSINPGDFLFIQNLYPDPKKPHFPQQIAGNHGVDGVIDCVGGALLGELIRCGASGGQVILYGGYRSERFELHNFDLLMKASVIKSYIYRYFFTPPQNDDAKLLREIVGIAGRPDFRVPVGGLHPLEQFRSAINETANHPERGKRFFLMSS
jgi:NADPH:quinone reductase-like Zn-dependent oxidoreductase